MHCNYIVSRYPIKSLSTAKRCNRLVGCAWGLSALLSAPQVGTTTLTMLFRDVISYSQLVSSQNWGSTENLSLHSPNSFFSFLRRCFSVVVGGWQESQSQGHLLTIEPVLKQILEEFIFRKFPELNMNLASRVFESRALELRGGKKFSSPSKRSP